MGRKDETFDAQAEVERIASAQIERNSLATQIAYAAGLRAHELFALQPVSERQASTHREWCADRFVGRSGERYTVEGKGGLVREVLLPKDLSERLEARRLVEPRQVTDRGVNYVQGYDLGGGGPGVRVFLRQAKGSLALPPVPMGSGTVIPRTRMQELQRSGMQYDEARRTVAQEVGHFDKKTTEAYLR